MNLVREPIWAALFALLQQVTWTDPVSGLSAPLKTYSRRLVHFDDLSLDGWPALYLAQGGERHATDKPGLSDRVILRANIWLYVAVPSDTGVPGTYLNPVLDQLQALFPSNTANAMSGKQTLGGLVQHAIITGDLETFEGTLGPKEVAKIPIEMLVIS